MLFHTWPFALFFIIVYPAYLVLKNTRLRFPWLLASSYFFYACFNPYESGGDQLVTMWPTLYQNHRVEISFLGTPPWGGTRKTGVPGAELET